MIKKIIKFILMTSILMVIFVIFSYSERYFNTNTFKYYLWFYHVISFIIISIFFYSAKQKINKAEKKANDRYKQSRIDPMTNVYNRLGLKEYGKNKWQEALYNNSSFAAIFIDIDQFKKFNDSYGHMVGDLAIKETANVLKECLRLETDIIVRYGGDEFILLLSDIEKPVVEKLVKRIQNNMEKVKIDQIKQNITLSFGINFISKVNEEINLEDIIDSSDKALYEAKKKSGNQYYFYNE